MLSSCSIILYNEEMCSNFLDLLKSTMRLLSDHPVSWISFRYQVQSVCDIRPTMVVFSANCTIMLVLEKKWSIKFIGQLIKSIFKKRGIYPANQQFFWRCCILLINLYVLLSPFPYYFTTFWRFSLPSSFSHLSVVFFPCLYHSLLNWDELTFLRTMPLQAWVHPTVLACVCD